ncbi:hypothetical protein ACH5RR_037533 [Cinchona calisaya]|uniref:Uncharacterized protein n=1 Tax=Cinchona calisaya TaxID=153742 RepID=A0ABD2Y6H1_9GENT
MIIRQILHSRKTLHKLKSPSAIIPHLISSSRPFSLSSHFQTLEEDDAEPIPPEKVVGENKNSRKPLTIYFKEAVGLSKKTPEDIETEKDDPNGELKRRLRKLEEELRSLKQKRKDDEKENLKQKKMEGIKKNDGLLKNEEKFGTLSSFFITNKGSRRDGGEKLEELRTLKMEDPVVYKELSSDMEMFVIHLYKNGYFKDSNFLPRNRFDVTCFENAYARDFIKFAAEKFGKDNQEVAKWLSGSDLKKVALFGCPSLGKKTVFCAKRLRRFFRIQENTVCGKCVLKESCKFVNQSVWKNNDNNLDMAVVMRIITLYALESVPPQLVVPDEMKATVSRLLKEAVNLSKTIS